MVRIYDLAMTHKLDADDFFIHSVQHECAEARLNFFLIEPLWAEAFFRALEAGQLWARVLLNMHSEHHQPQELYHRLIRLAAGRNVQVIDPPDRAMAAFDKARLHHRLIEAGLQVPPSVIVARDQASQFQLSEAQRQMLGSPFVIKPAMGYGRQGVILNATSEQDLARSIAVWPDTHYLVQRRIVPRILPNGEPAYFRVFFVFGTVWFAWWNCFNDGYRLVTPAEAAATDLTPMEAIIRQIAALTGMNFFSSEIAQTETGDYVVIDYVNDQCHMLSQSSNPKMGVPDELVAGIARRLVAAARELIQTPKTP